MKSTDKAGSKEIGLVVLMIHTGNDTVHREKSSLRKSGHEETSGEALWR